MGFVKPRIVVSGCLGFDACRYDGSKIQASIIDQLRDYVEFIKVCPEVAIGMTIPRESLRLTQNVEEPSLVIGKTGEDYTAKMNAFSDRFLQDLERPHGFLLKSRSPSCGTKDVKVYHTHGVSHVIGKGAGLFAHKVMNTYSTLPIEEDGRLTNLQLREAFFYKIFTLAEYDERITSHHDLIQFQAKHKFALLSYKPELVSKLGNIVANHESRSFDEVKKDYKVALESLLMDEPNAGRNINSLMHLYGYFKEELNTLEREHFFDLLEQYRSQKVPFSVPISLIYTWSLRFQNEYILKQSIIHPFPKELLTLSDTGKY